MEIKPGTLTIRADSMKKKTVCFLAVEIEKLQKGTSVILEGEIINDKYIKLDDEISYDTYLNIGKSLQPPDDEDYVSEIDEIIDELEKVKSKLTNNNDKISIQLKIDNLKATCIHK